MKAKSKSSISKKKKFKTMNKKAKKQTKSSKTAKSLVAKSMTFGDILRNYPESAEVLMNSGMHCIGCGASNFETLEQGALMHGIDPDKLVSEINKKLSKKRK